MIREVYEALKTDSRKGDFAFLVKQDLKDIKIYMSEQEIQNCSKWQWKKQVRKQVYLAAFRFLTSENDKKERKTRRGRPR